MLHSKLALALALSVALSCATPALAYEDPPTAEEGSAPDAPPSGAVPGERAAQTFYVRGLQVSATAYCIGGNNYLRLRDLGRAIDFEVAYDSSRDAINLLPGQPYSGSREDLPPLAEASVWALPSTQQVFADGRAIDLSGYTIGGYSYFKLRDIARALDFSVVYNGAAEAVEIDPDAHYFEHQGNTLILMYHAFTEDESLAQKQPSLYTTPDRLRENISTLRALGYEIISLEDYYNGKTLADKKYVILTIDDGYLNNYELAFPLLVEEQAPASIFAVVRDLSGGRAAHFSFAQAREMEESGFIKVYAHSLDHVDSTLLAPEVFASNLSTARLSITRNLEEKLMFFAYPYGAHNKDTYSLVKKAGYKLQMVQGRQFPADDILVRTDMYYDSDLAEMSETAVHN